LESYESSIAKADFNRDDIQINFDRIFLALCGDYPGAVTIRHSHKTFERLKKFDQKRLNSQGLDALQMESAESGYTSDRSVHRGWRESQNTRENESDDELLELQWSESDLPEYPSSQSS
jgi:hypothetical protein